MSVYAIHRMLQSRDLGPKKLLGPVQQFAAETQSCASVVPAITALLDDARPHGALVEAIEPLRDAAVGLSERIGTSLGAVSKLGARERLELERQLEPLGAEMQGLRNLLQILEGAIYPRPARLTLAELLAAPARGRPAFVHQTVEVHSTAGGVPFEADPRVMWGLVERSLLRLATSGIVAPFAAVSGRGGRLVIELGDVPAMTATIERIKVSLSAPHPMADAVLDAVAARHGASTGGSASQRLVTISVAA